MIIMGLLHTINNFYNICHSLECNSNQQCYNKTSMHSGLIYRVKLQNTYNSKHIYPSTFITTLCEM